MGREAAAWAAGGPIAVDRSVVGIWLWLQRSNDDVVGAEPLRFWYIKMIKKRGVLGVHLHGVLVQIYTSKIPTTLVIRDKESP